MAQKSITHYFKSPSNDNKIPTAQKKKEASKKRKREEINPKCQVEDKILDGVKKESETVLDESLQQKKSKIDQDVECEKLKKVEEDESELNGHLQKEKNELNDSVESKKLSVPEEKFKPLIEDCNTLLDGAEYNPSKRDYHPIKDAFWKKGSATPYLALSRTFQLIEEIKGRLKMIEILSNFFRSVILLSPDDLLACMYLSVNQLAPAHEGL